MEARILQFDMPEYYGTFVDLDNDTLVVGTPYASRLGFITGAVQVFNKSGDNWYESAVLGSSDGQRYLAFGESVSIDDKTVVTGALLPSGDNDYAPIGTTAYVHRLD